MEWPFKPRREHCLVASGYFITLNAASSKEELLKLLSLEHFVEEIRSAKTVVDQLAVDAVRNFFIDSMKQ